MKHPDLETNLRLTSQLDTMLFEFTNHFQDMQRSLSEYHAAVVAARMEVEGHNEVERLRDALRRLTFAVEQEHGASYRQLIIDAHAAMNA